ncbi:unnamed protein product, partial [Lampetra planeri]
ADLVSTIGESAALGSAGVIIWERSETKTERECQDLAKFVREVLGPYSINVTTATRLCSASLCQGKGRCVRQNPESSAYLHLPAPNGKNTSIPSVKSVLTCCPAQAPKATEPPEPDAKASESDPAEMWKKDFQCQWYKTADGDVSDQQSPKDGASIGGTVEGNAGDVSGTVGADVSADVSASTVASTTKGASGMELRGNDDVGLPATDGSPAPSIVVPTDCGTSPRSAPTLLLLLLAAGCCLEP